MLLKGEAPGRERSFTVSTPYVCVYVCACVRACVRGVRMCVCMCVSVCCFHRSEVHYSLYVSLPQPRMCLCVRVSIGVHQVRGTSQPESAGGSAEGNKEANYI